MVQQEEEEEGLVTAENMQKKITRLVGSMGVCANDRAGPNHPVGTFGRKREPNEKRLNSNTADLQLKQFKS